MECFEIKNLSFSYSGSSEKVLNDVSFSVNSGEFFTICGKSGCGKTTLLKNLKPTLTPFGDKSGEVLFFGKPVSELSLRDESRKIGFVQQNPDNMIVTDKVWHELSFGLENLGMPSDEIRLRVAETASFFGLQNLFRKKVSELSGGQKQLLNLASIMVMNPEVLVLDEPTSQLDPIAAQEFLDALKRVNRELGVTVIICEHRTEELFAVSDRIALMEAGTVAAVAKPGEFDKIIGIDKLELEAMLPVAMRVYSAVPNALPCPVTVVEGKRWLGETLKEKTIIQGGKEAKKTLERSETAVSVRDVFFRYEKDLPDILNGISTEIHFGEIYGVVGENGAGKSTFLSVVGGIRKPHRGNVTLAENCRVGVLPQNPTVLFLKKTVGLDLLEVLSVTKLSGHEKLAKVRDVAKLCEIEQLLERHPYDLSGGEQQRAALAKILLLDPNLILLDEPTKGMDAVFKQKFGAILLKLKSLGKAVVIVSHDIEFCAEFSDRCTMLFDGVFVSEGEPAEFFSGNRFYTTAANRMARDYIPDAVLAEDIVAALGGSMPHKPQPKMKTIHEAESQEKVVSKECEPKKHGFFRYILAVVFGLMFLWLLRMPVDGLGTWQLAAFQGGTVVLASLCVIFAVPKRFLSRSLSDVQMPKEKRKLSKRTLAACMMTLVAIPLTMFFGIFYLGDRRYYLISILIIIEIILPFFAVFEGRKPRASELVTISTLCAIGVAGRIVFAAIPQFKPMLALVIIAGVCFGGETGFLVGAMCGFVSNFYFGQGPWTPWQMFALGIVGFVAGILFSKGFLRKTRLSLCLYGGFAAIALYGLLMNISSIFMMQQEFSWQLAASYIAMGFPFDLVHASATVCFLWIASSPMIEKLERIKQKYGIMR